MSYVLLNFCLRSQYQKDFLSHDYIVLLLQGYGLQADDKIQYTNAVNGSLIRRFNQHSTMVLKACDKAVKKQTATATADTSAQSSTSSASATAQTQDATNKTVRFSESRSTVISFSAKPIKNY